MEEATSDKIFKYSYKADLGTYYLIAYGFYIPSMFFIIAGFVDRQIWKGILFACFFIILGFLSILEIWFSNWVYIDAKKRNIPQGGLWGVLIGGGISKSLLMAIIAPIAIYRYFQIRKKYPIVNSITVEQRHMWHYLVATVVWLFFAIPITVFFIQIMTNKHGLESSIFSEVFSRVLQFIK